MVYKLKVDAQKEELNIMFKKELKFKCFKETKGTWVYQEVIVDAEKVVGALYIRKDAFFDENGTADVKPDTLKVTITGEEG